MDHVSSTQFCELPSDELKNRIRAKVDWMTISTDLLLESLEAPHSQQSLAKTLHELDLLLTKLSIISYNLASDQEKLMNSSSNQ